MIQSKETKKGFLTFQGNNLKANQKDDNGETETQLHRQSKLFPFGDWKIVWKIFLPTFIIHLLLEWDIVENAAKITLFQSKKMVNFMVNNSKP